MLLLATGFFVFSVFRMIVNAFKTGLKMGFAVPVRGAAGEAAKVAPAGELKKCAACGVYNSATNSITHVRGGATVYYCSSKCQSKAATAA